MSRLRKERCLESEKRQGEKHLGGERTMGETSRGRKKTREKRLGGEKTVGELSRK